MKKQLKNKRLRGSTLAFTTLVLVVITLLIILLFAKIVFKNYFEAKLIQKEFFYTDFNSCLNLYLTDKYEDAISNKNLYLNSEISFNANTFRWGFFSVVNLSAKNAFAEYSKNGIVGYESSKDNNTCFYLADEGVQLSLCGNTKINGNAFVPAKSVKRGLLGNNPYIGEKLVYGELYQSQPNLPGIFEKTVDSVSYFLAEIIKYRCNGFFGRGSDVSNSFNNKLDLFYEESAIELDNVCINGHVIIQSDNMILVSSNAQINNVILVAPYIEFESGFRGCVQCVASDSVNIGKDCFFKYPSVISLIDNSLVRTQKKVVISSGTIVDGLVFVSPGNLNKNSSILYLHEDSFIKGQVYCDGILNAKGIVEGVTNCRQTIMFTVSSVYKNYLEGCEFDKMSDVNFKCILPITTYQDIKSIIKWVE